MLSACWQKKGVPQKLQNALRLLAQDYPLREGLRGDLRLEFKKFDAKNRAFRILINGKKALIEYTDITAALRGVGRLLCEEITPKKDITEETNFKTAGIMLDCSRNAVMRVEHFKGWLRKIALLGFNMAMLYTEDTYELAGEPYFGYQRGRYTAKELKQIDDYAAALGIEMIGCIQTLGHLEQVLKWGEYTAIRDTANVILVGDKKTYALIEKMLAHFARTYRSRRIHIGMDETQHFGRGRYMDINGCKPSFELFNEHLEKVVKLCKKYGLAPMLWSDMYFCMGSKSGTYYDKNCKIPASVKAKIPKDARLVYWDYYHRDEKFYTDMIRRHRELGGEPIMASGIWTWHSLRYDRLLTEQNAGACVRACKKAGVDEIFFTMWGDDGAYCDFDSAFAGIAYVSEAMYGRKISPALLEKRFAAVCMGDYRAVCLASKINMYEHITLGDEELAHSSSAIFWDDPLFSIYSRNSALKDGHFAANLRRHYKKLIGLLAKEAMTEDIRVAMVLAKILYHKTDIQIELEKAYKSRRKQAVKAVAKKTTAIIKLLEEFDRSLRKMWLERNKPQGLEVLQIRIAGQIRRYKELGQRLKELAAKKISAIDELEENPKKPLPNVSIRYRDLATASSII